MARVLRRPLCTASLKLGRICQPPPGLLGTARPAPSLFVYPGLTAKPWHERSDPHCASWVSALESAVPSITEEYLALRESGAPSDYQPESSDHDDGLHKGGEWHWATLIDRGRKMEDMWARCPRTAAALSAVPGLCVGDMPFAFAFFSTLRAGCSIAAHTSPCNLRVRVHLPLLVPARAEACGIEVAGETRQWERGKALIFDDAFTHRAWNDSSEDRVVLLLDLWHWELTDAEIAGVQAMFRAVDEKREQRARQT